MTKRSGGLKKWFKEEWVDIGSPKKGGGLRSAEESLQKDQKENIPNVCLNQKHGQ